MGNTVSNSEHVNIDDFKEQVFSQVVFFVAKYANHELEFKDKYNCTPNTLPQLKNQDFQSIIDYYQGGTGELDYCIENYLNKHVLNSTENATRFHKILMTKLSQDSEELEGDDLSEQDFDLVSVASNVKQFIESYKKDSPPSPPNNSLAEDVKTSKTNKTNKTSNTYKTNKTSNTYKTNKTSNTNATYITEPPSVNTEYTAEFTISENSERNFQRSVDTDEDINDYNIANEIKEEFDEEFSYRSNEPPEECLISHI
jgi:hypothetical protein